MSKIEENRGSCMVHGDPLGICVLDRKSVKRLNCLKHIDQSPPIVSLGVKVKDRTGQETPLLAALFPSITNTLHVLSASAADSHTIACGALDRATDDNNRKWGPDINFLDPSGNSLAATAQYQDPSLPSTVPYMTARIFTSNSSYTFPVPSNSRIWIRLHFYPATYGDLDPSISFFSVIANGFTLLNNFSASITAKALTQAYIIREFSMVPQSSGSLKIVFTPSTQQKGMYAFINGIEVVPMPDIFNQPAALIGYGDDAVNTDSLCLQTMFRLNVGGQYIPPTNDSGLSRTWYDDSPYLFGAAMGITSQADDDVRIRYSTDVPNYIAPFDVYSTARSMGPDSTVNLNFNLTWIFQVDANFTYLVRFHFCEFRMTKTNQRVFDIFVNNQTAQPGADVVGWGGSADVAVYKDYAIYVTDQPGDDQLFVALHPSNGTKPEYYDALLNGLEVFKLNDKSLNLAGPNPVPSEMMEKAEEEKTKNVSSGSHRHASIIGGIAGGAAGCVIAAAVVLFVSHKKRKNGSDDHSGNAGNWLPLYGNSHTTMSKSTISGKSTASSHLSSLAGGLCRHFSLSEIKHATKHFDESQVIGVGGFGKVYKGIIDMGTEVAIKRSNPSSQQGVHEFQTEIEMLSKLRHRHLVSLIGFCEEGGEMALVYDYMANGTLREHLYKSNKPSVPWKKSTMVKGSFGYLDPEYYRRQQLTEKSDVYSFGVVLFEVLCARAAIDPSLPKDQICLGDWALDCKKRGILEEIIDPQLKGCITVECLKNFAETAEKCLSDHGIDRPTMGDVLWNLEFALQLQDNPTATKLVVEHNASDAYDKHRALLGIDEESVLSTNEIEDQNSNAVFSQLVNPRGR
ncbi:hypothetical protein ACFE04_014488 [Oxalis oulophora]